LRAASMANEFAKLDTRSEILRIINETAKGMNESSRRRDKFAAA